MKAKRIFESLNEEQCTYTIEWNIGSGLHKGGASGTDKIKAEGKKEALVKLKDKLKQRKETKEYSLSSLKHKFINESLNEEESISQSIASELTTLFKIYFKGHLLKVDNYEAGDTIIFHVENIEKDEAEDKLNQLTNEHKLNKEIFKKYDCKLEYMDIDVEQKNDYGHVNITFQYMRVAEEAGSEQEPWDVSTADGDNDYQEGLGLEDIQNKPLEYKNMNKFQLNKELDIALDAGEFEKAHEISKYLKECLNTRKFKNIK